MKDKKGSIIALICLSITFWSCRGNDQTETSKTHAVHGNRAGAYKGYLAINADLKQRVFPEQDIYIFLQPSAEGPLVRLLGGFSDLGSSNKFMNGTPNATNMALWVLMAQNIAKHIADQCAYARIEHKEAYASYEGRKIKINSDMKGLLAGICFLGIEPKADMLISLSQGLWMQVVGFEAPYSEFEAFRDFFLLNEDRLSGRNRVEAMMLAMLLNPYYLLEQ